MLSTNESCSYSSVIAHHSSLLIAFVGHQSSDEHDTQLFNYKEWKL